MGPRSAGFDEIEAGYAQQAAEDEEPREPEDHDEDEGDEDEGSAKPADADEDEFAIAEREYLNEMRTGIHIAEEDGISI